jgi:hypothetical protein
MRGALGPGDGTVAAIGTGSFFGRRSGGAYRYLGGWGYQLGDEASGDVVVVILVRSALGLGHLDAVALDLVDGADVHAIGADDLHVLANPAKIGHRVSPLPGFVSATHQRAKGCPARPNDGAPSGDGKGLFTINP